MVVILLTWKYLLSPCRSNIIITHQRKGGLWVGVWPSVSSSLDCKSKCLYSSRIVMITQFFWVAVMKDLAYNVSSWSNFNLSWKGYKGWIGESFYVENWDNFGSGHILRLAIVKGIKSQSGLWLLRYMLEFSQKKLWGHVHYTLAIANTCFCSNVVLLRIFPSDYKI